MTRNDPNWMWAEACEFLARAERLHQQFFHPAGPQARRPVWEPPVDVFESAGALWILVALPGVAPDQVEVLLGDGELVVAGERRLPRELCAGAVHRLEIPHGRFERRIVLPQGPLQVEERRLLNGCLILSLRRPR